MKIAARLGQDIKQEMEGVEGGEGTGGRKTIEEGGRGRRRRLAAAAVTAVNAA